MKGETNVFSETSEGGRLASWLSMAILWERDAEHRGSGVEKEKILPIEGGKGSIAPGIDLGVGDLFVR
jgi:hypothetical protein